MVQVLPALPTFGEKLVDSLSGAASNYFAGKSAQKVKEKDQMILDKANDPNLTPFQRANLYAGLSSDKLKALGPTLAALSKAGVQADADKQRLSVLAQLFPDIANQSQSGQGPQNDSQSQGSPLNNLLAQTSGGSPQAPQGQAPIEGMQNEGEIEQKQPKKERYKPSQQDIQRAVVLDESGQAAKVLQAQRDEALKLDAQEQTQSLAREKAQETKRYHQQAEKIQIHEQSKDHAKQIREDEKRAHHTLTAVKSVKNALKNHKTGALTWENFFKKQFKGTVLENLPLTKEGAIIEANIPAFIEGGKELFGQRLSDADLAVVLGKTIDLGKSNEANEAILDLAEFSANLSMNKSKIANEIVKENGGYRPIDFDRQVDERFQERYGQEIDDNFRKNFGPKSTDVHMKAPDGGDLYVPVEDVDKYIELGAQVL